MRRITLAIGVALAFGLASPASSAARGCGGEKLRPKPGGSKWICTFDDEFDAATGDARALDRSRWTPQVTDRTGFTTGPLLSEACYVDSRKNVSVSHGALHLTARREPSPIGCALGITPYTSGMVTTYGHFSQAYGRFEVRAKLPHVTAPGLHETLWLWPVDDTRYGSWPASGEVDFSEFYSRKPNLDIPYIHYDYEPSTTSGATHSNIVTKGCAIHVSRYNDYALIWSRGRFKISVNHRTCLIDKYAPSNVSSPAPFDQPFLISLTQALGVGTNAFDPSSTPLPATTSVDYVRVWK
jgi:beta-glucanase (GH16 family)